MDDMHCSTVNSKFLQIALEDIFTTLKIRD